jgi:hypothetical protein
MYFSRLEAAGNLVELLSIPRFLHAYRMLPRRVICVSLSIHLR